MSSIHTLLKVTSLFSLSNNNSTLRSRSRFIIFPCFLSPVQNQSNANNNYTLTETENNDFVLSGSDLSSGLSCFPSSLHVQSSEDNQDEFNWNNQYARVGKVSMIFHLNWKCTHNQIDREKDNGRGSEIRDKIRYLMDSVLNHGCLLSGEWRLRFSLLRPQRSMEIPKYIHNLNRQLIHNFYNISYSIISSVNRN